MKVLQKILCFIKHDWENEGEGICVPITDVRVPIYTSLIHSPIDDRTFIVQPLKESRTCKRCGEHELIYDYSERYKDILEGQKPRPEGTGLPKTGVVNKSTTPP